jgi:hypothetical protein
LYLDVIRYWSYTLNTRYKVHYKPRQTIITFEPFNGGGDYTLALALFSSRPVEVHNPAEESKAVPVAEAEAAVAVMVLVGVVGRIPVEVVEHAVAAGKAAVEADMAVEVEPVVDARVVVAKHQNG